MVLVQVFVFQLNGRTLTSVFMAFSKYLQVYTPLKFFAMSRKYAHKLTTPNRAAVFTMPTFNASLVKDRFSILNGVLLQVRRKSASPKSTEFATAVKVRFPPNSLVGAAIVSDGSGS